MNEEIKEYDKLQLKELLERLKDINNYTGFKDGAFKYYLGKYEANILLDYITNLQEENKKYNKWIESLNKDNLRLRNIIKEVREYIENTAYADITGLEKHSIKEFWFVKELLEILDKEK